MKQQIEEQREQLKERICNELDKYYEELSTGLEGRRIKIDDIERILGETQKKVVEKITEAAGEAVSSTEPPTKKTMSALRRGYEAARKTGDDKGKNTEWRD